MSQQDFELAVAQATGESRRTIRRRGFSVIELDDQDFDPEPNALVPQYVDWDVLDSRRRAAA